MKTTVKSFLAKLNLDITPLSTRISTTTKSVGASGAAEVLSYFIKNHGQLSHDAEIASFINFYCDNWSLSSSQWSQDIFVMFASKMKQGGRFLEIGGADGFAHSNTYSLEK